MTKQQLVADTKRALREAKEPAAKWHTTHWGAGGATHHAGWRLSPVPGRAPLVRVAYEAATPLPVRHLAPDTFLRLMRQREGYLRVYRRVLLAAGLAVEWVDGSGALDEAHRTWPHLLVRPGEEG